MSIFAAIANAFRAVAALFGYAQQRDAEKNSPAMQANASAKTDAQIAATVSQAEDAAATGNLDDVRKLAAE